MGMTDRSKLLALAGAVEKLTGPDREVDCLICHACFEHSKTETGYPYWVDWEGKQRIIQHTPYFTEFIDSAIRVIPKGAIWSVNYDGIGASTGDVCCTREDGSMITGACPCVEAATPALALLAASLRARAALLQQPPIPPRPTLIEHGAGFWGASERPSIRSKP